MKDLPLDRTEHSDGGDDDDDDKPKKSEAFMEDVFKRFLMDACDEKYLLMKVIMVDVSSMNYIIWKWIMWRAEILLS